MDPSGGGSLSTRWHCPRRECNWQPGNTESHKCVECRIEGCGSYLHDSSTLERHKIEEHAHWFGVFHHGWEGDECPMPGCQCPFKRRASMKRHLIKYHGLDDALATSQSDASVPPRGERMWLRLSLENRLPPDAIPHPDTIAQAPAADTRSDATPDTSFFESPIFTEPGLAESPEASVTLTDTNAPPTSLPVRLSYRNSVVLGWEVYLFRISSILDSDPMTVPERLVYCPLPFVQYYAAQILCGRDPPWAALLSSWLLDLQVDCACHNFFIFDHWSYIQANFPLSSDQVAEFLLLTEPVWANFLITVFVPSHYYS